MRWSTRVLLSSLAAILIPLVVLTAVGISSVADQLSRSSEGPLRGSARAVSALVASSLDDARREAQLLARDPAIVQGVLKNDWGTLARGASPRMLSLTLDGIADLVLVLDERGAPLVRVPASAELPASGLPAASAAEVRIVSGAPMLLGAAAVTSDGRALGTVLVGKRLDPIAKRLGVRSAPLDLVFLAGEAPIYTTFARGAGGVRWGEAARARRVEVHGASYLMRAVGRWPAGTLWVLVPDADIRATETILWTWVAGFLLFAGSATFAATWLLSRRVLRPIEALGASARRVASGDFDARVPVPLGGEAELGDVANAFNEMGISLQGWRREVEHKNRELEALNAVAFTVSRTVDLVSTAEDTLEVVRRVAEMDVAVLYQVDEGGETLTLVAQRGFSPETAERFRTRPVEGSELGRAVQSGRATLVHDLPSAADTALGAFARERGHQTQLALPIPVKAEVWGVMGLIATTRREFSPEEMQLMEAVAYQVGVAVERASLFTETREKGQRLESLVGLAQTVTASLDPAAVLDEVSRAASRLVPDSAFRLWVLEDDRLVLRVESGTRGSPGARRTAFALGEGLVGHVGHTREPLVVDRVLDDPRTVNLEWMRHEGCVSYAGIPLLFQSRLLGVLAILTRRPHRFTKEEVDLLLSFGTQAAIAMENARLYAEASRSAAEHQALLEVGGLVGSTLRVERVLDLIVERAGALLGVRAAGIFKVDAASGILTYERGIGLSPEFVGALRVRAGEGTSGKALRYRAPAWSGDLLEDGSVVLSDETRALVSREGYRAVLSVPILIKNEPTGVLAVYWWEPHSPTFSEVRLLSALAGQAAVALENAQLYEASTRRGKRLETLAALTQTLTATLAIEDVLGRVVGAAVELFGSSVSRLWLLDEDGETVTLRAHAGAVSQVQGVTRLRIGEGLVGRIVATRAPLVVPDLREDSRVVNRVRIQSEGVVSLAAAPLLLGDRALGAISIALRESHAFSEEEVSLLQSLANHAAIAIQNARLYQAAARRAARMRTLAEMGRDLASTFDVQRILDTVTARCRESLDISDVGIFTLDEATSELLFLHGFGSRQAFWRSHRLRLGEGVAGLAVAENRLVETPDVLDDPAITLRPETRARVESVGTRAVLALPLFRERAFGALVVHRERGYRFSGEEKEFLATFANQVAVALENARLFALEQARRGQVEALVEIERELAAELNTERLLDLIIQRAGALLDARGVVYLLDGASATLVPHSWYNMPAQVRDRRIPVGVGLAGAVAAERRGLLANDYDSTPFPASLRARGVPLMGTGHAMAQPLVSHDQLLGVIALSREADPRFTDRDLETFQSFATQAAIALENARLYREAKEHGERLKSLDEVNRLVSSSLEVEEVLRNIAQAVSSFFEAPQAHVWVAEPGGGRLRRSVSVGDPEIAAGMADDLALGEGGVGWVAEHREPIMWTDLEQDHRVRARKWALKHGLRYFTAYPIVLGDRLLGAITLHRRSPYPVTPETEGLLRSLVAQAAVAVDNARLYAETTRRLQETQALLEVSEILSSTLDSTRLLKHVTMKTAQVCRVDRCTIQLWEGDRMIPIMSQFADGRKRPDLWARFMTISPFTPQDVPAYAIAIQTKKPVLIPDASRTDLLPPEWVETYGHRAYLSVPLIRQDQVVGVMNLDYTDRDGVFEQWQVNLAVTIAGQVALALENSRLYAEIRERLNETQTLLAVGQVLSQNLPTQEAMRQVAREVGRAFGADMVGAYFLDAKRESLRAVAGYHVPRELLQRFLENPFPIAQLRLVQEATETHRPVWTSDAIGDPRWFARDLLQGVPPHSVLFAPTPVRGEIIGGLFLVWWRVGRTFAPAELRLIEGVASQVGLALENADLARQTEEKLQETETLLSVSRTLSTTLDLYPLLRHFLRQVARTIDCDSVGVWLVNPTTGRLEPVVGYRVPPELLATIRKVRIDPQASSFYAEAFRSRRVQVASSVAEDPRIPDEMKRAAPHTAQLFAPIVAKERVIGAFIAVWWERAREFSERELALIEAMGSQAGVAVENARLFEDNRRRLEELSVLHELSRAVTGQLDLAALVRAIHQQVGRILDARNMVILFYDEASREIQVALRLLEDEEVPEPRRYPLGQGLMTRVLERRQPIQTDHYDEECRRQGVEPVESSRRYPYWMGVPMAAGDQTIGVLILRSDVHPYTPADERLLVNVAGLAALAIRSARLFDERTRAYSELAAAQDQLIRTEKLRALGEMASGVAHDFNNLLASILGRAQLLMRRVEDPKLLQWLGVIERAATDGARTVKRIQEFARIRRDQPFVAVDVNRVVRDALEVTQSRWQEEAQSRGVTIAVNKYLAPVPPIAGDPAELREVLTNLILNALDAMPDGGALGVTTQADASTVTVTVSDTGVGIPTDVQPLIFDPFFTTKGARGTGLGLSITYGIVSRHRGQIHVESAEGRGATFILTFPVSPAEVDPPLPVSLRSVPPLRCLVVDDEEPVLEMLGDLLTSGGHSATLVTDGATAIERFKAEPFDMVFTDLAMPGVNGWQVARAVKDLVPATPVLLITGWGVELSPEALRAHGVDAVLSKPLKLEDLLRAVAAYAPRRADADGVATEGTS